MIFLERMREGYCQSDEHWNYLKGNNGEISERWGGVHKKTFRSAQIPSCTELNWIVNAWTNRGKDKATHDLTSLLNEWQSQAVHHLHLWLIAEDDILLCVATGLLGALQPCWLLRTKIWGKVMVLYQFTTSKVRSWYPTSLQHPRWDQDTLPVYYIWGKVMIPYQFTTSEVRSLLMMLWWLTTSEARSLCSDNPHMRWHHDALTACYIWGKS